ncbi:MAG: DUF3244 domain-containing protein [Bacteroidales bacterium]|nr:DUF3244 domain-containing protein [Bacteroidales bacterium]
MKRVFLAIVLFQISILMVEAKQTIINDKVDVCATHSNTYNGTESRSETISADITGHTLTITFNDNVGIAHIVIKDSNGVYIDRENVFSTPDYATFIIDDAGYYRMDITLSNGEQYYGYFRVEN